MRGVLASVLIVACSYDPRATETSTDAPASDAPIDADGALALDLTRTPIWFGTPALPERVDAATIAHERELARTSGVGPPALGERLIAQPSPALVFVRSRDELDPYLADLVELYSPEEADLVRGLRVPLTR